MMNLGMPEMTPDLKALGKRLLDCRHLVVLTGAGMSAESGVPTFRDAQTGLWSRYRPEELATPEAFRRQPQLVWSWYQWRRSLVAKAEPHRGHLVLAELEMRFPKMTLITQNVDGLHQRGGSRTVIELHGSLVRSVCADCRRTLDEDNGQQLESPPSCPACGGLARPAVVWFGESLPETALYAAVQAVESADVCLVVGTSALVQPAASLPFMAVSSGACVVEINPEVTPFSPSAHVSLRDSARTGLQRVLHLVEDESWYHE